MQSNPIVWVEIYVQDMARARAFYEAVFQFSLTPMTNPNPEDFSDMQMWAFPSTMEGYGSPGALVKMSGSSSNRGGTMVYFGCKDCAVEAARAAAKGGRLISEKMSIGAYGFITVVEDTEGNVIGLHSMA